MKYFFKLIVIALIPFCMISCGYDEISEKLIPKEESDFAKEFLSKLKSRDFEYVQSLLSHEIAAQIDDELLVKMADHFRSGELISTKIIGSQVNIFNGEWKGNFTFEYEFESGWNLANTALRKTSNGYEVIGLNVYQPDKSQKEINAFKLSAKTPLQYIVLVFSVVVPLFIFVTLIACIKTPIPSKKWVWIIFVFLGVGAIQVNWTNGLYSLQLLSLNLFGASASAAGPAAPWIVSASMPLGAIMFWIKRKKFIALADEANKSIHPIADASAD